MVERNQNIIRFRCTQCGSPLKAMVTRVGHALSCPQCGAEVEVPGRDAGSSNAADRTAAPATKPVRPAAPLVPAEPTPAAPDDEYAVRGMDYSVRAPAAAEHSGLAVPVAGLPDDYEAPGRRPDREWKEEEVKPPDERPKLPPRPMVDGVLRCFGQMPTILCWGVLSLFVSALVGVAYHAVRLGSIEGIGTWVGSMLLTGAVTLVALLTVIVANAYLMAILHDSAAGNDLIVNWPDAMFLTWATDAFFLITSIAVPFILAWTLTYPLGGLLAGGWVILIPMYWLLFPIVLLSTLEMQSPLVP
ncbi:MAG TPA: hypothetical protein DD670_05420, partial [Planctomycetaceae bacterium]|nr:hypothetical protein [Planctomycetaceae bacterium]